MTSAVVTEGLTKRYGRRTALSDCTLDIPAGHVVGLVGPNGAGKSTLLGLACGVIAPTTGRIEVLGNRPGPARPNWPGSGSSRRTPPSTAACRSATTCDSARGSTPAGTGRWPSGG